MRFVLWDDDSVVRDGMRCTVLLSCLLGLAACTIRDDTFTARSDGGTDGALSLADPEPLPSTNPRLADDTIGCRGAFARGTSSMHELRDSTWDPFCD